MRIVKDRRSSLRVALLGDAVIQTDREELHGQCVDLGLGGMAVLGPRYTRSKDIVTIEATLLGERLILDALLVRRKNVDGDYLMGFRFVDVGPRTQRKLEQLIHARLAQADRPDLAWAFALQTGNALPALPVETDPGDDDDLPAPLDRTMVAPTPPEAIETPETTEALVVSGHTEAIVVPGHTEALVVSGHTVVAPAPAAPTEATPTPTATERGATESGTPSEYDDRPPGLRPVHIGDAWLEEQDRTGVFQRTEVLTPAERTLVTPPAERTLVTPPAERTLVTPPAERTLVTPPAERTMVTPVAERTRVETRNDAQSPDRIDRTMTLPSPVAPGLQLEPGVPQPLSIAPSLTIAMDFDAGWRSIVRPAPMGPDSTMRIAYVPPRPAPVPPPLLRSLAAIVHHASSPSEAAPPPDPANAPEAPSPRPSQQALLQAKALLQRPRDPRAPRRPRVIVSIPHETNPTPRSRPWSGPRR